MYYISRLRVKVNVKSSKFSDIPIRCKKAEVCQKGGVKFYNII
jgi:hypothetical protein